MSPEHPLVGIELKMLETWQERSPAMREAYADPETRAQVETMVRHRSDRAHKKRLRLRSDGMEWWEAEAEIAPMLWMPPKPPSAPPDPHQPLPKNSA